MKTWMWIVLAVAIFAVAAYLVVSKGGVLEMQQEHEAGAPTSASTATAAPKH